MTIAVMQPYVFPYIGYFQLIKASDVFVLYDDVNFIKQGWINRNKIMVSGKEFVFAIPLKDASSFKKICETEVNIAMYDNWKVKFLRTVEQSYKKAPYFNQVYKLLYDILNEKHKYISELASNSIIKIGNYLEIVTKFKNSSEYYPETKTLDREQRLVEIVKRNKGNDYINPIGGQELYSKDAFLEKGIILNFIKSNQILYKQFDNEFLPFLSIIDVLMFNNVDEINKILDQYQLL
jgi:hypothetical protein